MLPHTPSRNLSHTSPSHVLFSGVILHIPSDQIIHLGGGGGGGGEGKKKKKK